MTTKKNKKCGNCKTMKKCKRLCVLCLHIFTDNDEKYCSVHNHEERSCVDDSVTTIYHKCIEHNKDGECKRYEANIEEIQRHKLIKELENYKNVKFNCMNGSGYYGEVAYHLIDDLLRVLHGGKSKFILIESYYDDGYSDWHVDVIPTKSFYDDGTDCKRHYKEEKK